MSAFYALPSSRLLCACSFGRRLSACEEHVVAALLQRIRVSLPAQEKINLLDDERCLGAG